jgi:hypothetical protein
MAEEEAPVRRRHADPGERVSRRRFLSLAAVPALGAALPAEASPIEEQPAGSGGPQYRETAHIEAFYRCSRF